MTEQDPSAFVFDPEIEPGPPDAGRDAVGASENTDVDEPGDAGCVCDEEVPG